MSLDFNTLVTNPWIIGIAGGVVGTYLTQQIFIKRTRTDYMKRVEAANGEALASMRSFILEKTLPSPELVRSMFLSISRLNRVSIKDLFSTDTLCEELTHEVMTDNYLTTAQKIDYSQFIAELRNHIKSINPKDTSVASELKLVKANEESANRRIMYITFAALILTVFAVMQTSAFQSFISALKSFNVYQVIAISMLTPIIILFAAQFINKNITISFKDTIDVEEETKHRGIREVLVNAKESRQSRDHNIKEAKSNLS